jgi:transposase
MSPKEKERKAQVLRDHGSLYPHPERVTDELFQEVEFFDSHDLVQVKYEMLRRVRMEQWSVTRAAETFGFSRPAFYQAQATFEEHGVAGLLPQKRGPKRAHKLSDEVMRFIDTITQEVSLSPPAIAQRVQEHFGLSVHPRSIERAQKRRGKKRGQAL